MASGMHDERIVTSGFVVTPETVATRTFTSTFRGFDQTEVRGFLKRVSEELAGAAEREAQLRRLLQEAQNRAAHPEVDEEMLTTALGEHAARLLGSAREHAASIKAEAEAKATRVKRDHEAEMSRIRSEADSLLARRVEEVDGVTANLRNAAEADARALREQAKADVDAELQAARSQGRDMVAEARAVRERILADLARRRHVAEVQLDQLRAARERLLGAYALVRRTLDEATQELKMAEVEARLAADEVGRRAPEPPPMPAAMPASPGPRPADAESRGRRDETGTQPSTSPHLAATAVRAGRTEPAVRPEPRFRPPGRPGDSRPSPASPSRRPVAAEPPGRPNPEPSGARAHGGEPPRRPEPASSGARAHAGEQPGSQRAPAPPTGPPPLGTPVGPPVSGTRTGSPPEPPPILPRPVPPPPPRHHPASVDSGPASPPAGTSPSAPAAPPAEDDDRPWPAADDRVDVLFARIKADRAATVAGSPVPPAPPVVPPVGRDIPTGPLPEEEAAAGPAARPGSAGSPARPAGAAHVADEAARARRDELLDPIAEALARQLKRVLQDEQNEVLDRLRRKRRRHGGSPLLAADERIGRLREAAESVLEDAVRAGIRFADANASEAHAEESAGREVATALARHLAEPLRERLDRALEEAGGERDSAEVSEAVSGVYRQWRAQEVEPLARHHAVVAFSRGAYAAYAEGTGLRWVVDDEAPCPDCDDNDLAATVIKGQAYPTGQVHPPAHPGCRCLLVPAV